ncbi:MAG TPA: glycosyltransferase family 4 protein [Longimicrobium sp.]|nr:glycosyltransferase family 4 protein [Longimicrobium sp.]
MFILAHNNARIFGGGELGTVRLLEGLQARGHRVLMLFRDEKNAARAAEYGIPTGVHRIGGDAMLPHAVRFSRRLRRERPDAVILTTFRRVFLAGMGAWRSGVPFVVQRIVLQGNVPTALRHRIALRRWVDAVVLNAGAMRPGFLAADPGLDPAKVIAILDGVRAPVATREPGAVRRELGIPDGARVVGSVARLAWQKRFDRLLRALAVLPPDVHCVIAGEGGQGEKLRALAAELGMADRLHLVGFRADVGDVLGAMDAFAVSSDSEGMANAMLEAMMAGVPVVSTDVSGAREALEPEPGEPLPGIVTGFDETELADALRRVLYEPGQREAMGRAARERAERRFGWDRFVDEWEALLVEGVRRGRDGR